MKPQKNYTRPERESTPFDFKVFMNDLIPEAGKFFKLSVGTIKVSGWTRHCRDVDVDCVVLESNGTVIDIKPHLEYFGGMKRIDNAAKCYLRTNYYQSTLKAV